LGFSRLDELIGKSHSAAQPKKLKYSVSSFSHCITHFLSMVKPHYWLQERELLFVWTLGEYSWVGA